MLGTGLLLPLDNTPYFSALTAPGNNRSAVMPRSASSGAVALGVGGLISSKMVRLHQKPLEGRPKPLVSDAALSVYAPRPKPATRASTNSFPSALKHNKSGTSSRSSHINRVPMLQKRNPNSAARSVDASHMVRRSLPSTASSSPAVSSSTGGSGLEKRVTKVYLSQKQSAPVKDCGVLVPGAPPATPTPEHMKLYEYVPSLADIKAQRHMKHKLESITKGDARQIERRKEQAAKNEKQNHRERIMELRRRQRQEIYALNKVMTEFEYKNFEELVKTRGLNE